MNRIGCIHVTLIALFLFATCTIIDLDPLTDFLHMLALLGKPSNGPARQGYPAPVLKPGCNVTP